MSHQVAEKLQLQVFLWIVDRQALHPRRQVYEDEEPGLGRNTRHSKFGKTACDVPPPTV
jgi:hypothetical protein